MIAGYSGFRAERTARDGRRAHVVAVLLLAGTLAPPPAPVTCREPLSSADLRALDERAVADPIAAIMATDRALAAE